VKIALFGASGFVGSNLAHAIVETSDHTVTLCDIEDSKLKLRFENAPFHFEHVDISSQAERVEEIVADSDLVFDLAAYVHPAMFVAKPLDVVQLNFFDCLNVINSCVKTKTRLIHFSTSEVYGKTSGSVAAFKEDESDLIVGPIQNQRWIYSCAKQLLDRMIYAHGIENGLDFTLVRPFNFVGPLMDKYVRDWSFDDNPRVFANFMSSLAYNRPIQLVDGGKNRRCFTHIDDATAALCAIIDHKDEMNRQIVNIGNPENECTIAELAMMMRDLYQAHFDPSTNVPIKSVPSSEFYGKGYEDCDRRLPDISKLQAIGWNPRKGLDETILSSMRYFVDNKSRLVDALGE